MTDTRLSWVVKYTASGPSPTCEDRNIELPEEWGVLKTTAIQWTGWREEEHKTLPEEFWGATHLEIHKGDVVVTKAGPRHRVGVSAYVYKTRPRLIVSGKMILLRVNESVIDPRYLNWHLATPIPQAYLNACKTGMAESQMNFANEDLLGMRIQLPPLDEQRRIADFLDSETARIDQLMSGQLRVLDLLEERANSRVLELIGQSLLAKQGGAAIVPMRRVIKKLNRPVILTDQIITAFRDGQVTSRSIRRSEGYTLAASAEPQGQGVATGDIVVHGLDGFAGAVGDSEASGNCSPVYHVCIPIDGGSPAFYGRLLRLLALSDYLALFGASARERAVDFRNWKIFGHAPIPEVEPVIQHEIGNLITKTRPLREEVKRFNKRLTERRQALITAVVTGQIDVTTAQGVAV